MWIKLHDTLPDHPKVLASASALAIDKDVLIGKLCRLWLWAATGREDGFIADSEAETVAEVVRWRKSPVMFLEALCVAPVRYASGLLDKVDGGYIIHDWDEQVATMLDTRNAKREQTRQRVQRYRERNVTQDVTRYQALQPSVTVTQCNALRVDKSRVEEKRVDESIGNTPIVPVAPAPTLPPDPPEPPTPKTPSAQDRRFDEFWTFYPKKTAKLDARKVWDKLRPDDTLHKRILSAIVAAKKSKQWTDDGGQYIPAPARWLRGGRWEDEPGTAGQQPAISKAEQFMELARRFEIDES